MFIDSHCHLDFPDLAKDLDVLLRNMQENQVTHALCVSVDLPNFPRVLALAEKHQNLFACVGIHPDYEDQREPAGALSPAHPRSEKNQQTADHTHTFGSNRYTAHYARGRRA